MKSKADAAKVRTVQEQRCQRQLLRLMVSVSAVRKTLTILIPRAGSAAWWLAPLCLLPGALIAAVLAFVMKASGANTLKDCAEKLLGKWGRAALAALLTLWLLVDAVSDLTALITFFTEGIGTEGTRQTIALLTCGVLLLCLECEGTARAAFFFRWTLRLTGLLLVLNALSLSRMDQLFPVLGSVRGDVGGIVHEGFALSGLAVLMLMTEAPGGKARTLDVIAPLSGSIVAALMSVLIVPDRMLIARKSVAEALLTPMLFMHAAVRLLGACLVILASFLAIAGAAGTIGTWTRSLTRWSAKQHTAIAAVLICVTQVIDKNRIWSIMTKTDQILFMVMVMFACVLCVCFIFRGRRRR